jgi:anti-anti-sigma factor
VDGLAIERTESSTLRLSGELDLASSATLDRYLEEIKGPVRLDVARLTFMDSTGLRVILRRLKATPVILRHPTPQVIRLLALCGVRHLVGLTVESAPDQAN